LSWHYGDSDDAALLNGMLRQLFAGARQIDLSRLKSQRIRHHHHGHGVNFISTALASYPKLGC
jgi:hypothetical protein